MKPPTFPLLLSSLLTLTADPADALRLGLRGKHVRQSHLQRRASLTGTTTLNNTANIQYATNITMGGSPFTVIIDTGSSDLYVAGSVPGATDTHAQAGVQYAVGSVQGPVKLATLEFAGYTVQNQAYLEVVPDQTNALGTGLIGLGPNVGSQVLDALSNQPQGDPPLDRIFQQNTSTPNYITILLGRDDDPGEVFPGDLTVGELIPGYEDVTSQPQLPVSVVPVRAEGDQHWQTLLDPDGIIGPDGKAIDVKTGVQSTQNQKQLTAVFDSGFSLPQVPKAVSDAIYSGAKDAKFVQDKDLGSTWTLSCDEEINISFKIGGKDYPVHPLDTVLDLNYTDTFGRSRCIGAFQPISTAQSPNFDVILGMAFIRNAYLYINFGDFVAGKTNQTADPYIQLLSITNTSATHADFVKARGNSITDTAHKAESWLHDHLALVIALAAGLLGLILLGVFGYCIRNRRMRRTPAGFMNLQSSYQPLGTPAPNAAYEYNMQPVGGGGYAPPPGAPPQHQQYGNYNNPWDARY